MKKISKWMLAAILLCGLTVISSCSKDDDEPSNTPDPTPTPTTTDVIAFSAQTKFYVVLAEDMLELFDVLVKTQAPYTGHTSRVMTKTTWIGSEVIDGVGDPSTFALSVTVTPKAGVTPDTSKDYKLGLALCLAYDIQDKNQKTLVAAGERPQATVAEISGSQLTEAKLKQTAEAYTTLGEEIKLDVYEDYYVFKGQKFEY